MEVFDAEFRAIGIALRKAAARAEALRALGVTTVAVFSDSQSPIRWAAHIVPGPGQQLPRAINEHARALHAQGIEVVVHCVLQHSGIPGNEEADRQANRATSAKCKSVRKQHATLPDTPGDLTSASKYF